MIVAAIVCSLIVTILFALAALGIELVLSVFGWPRRGLWLLTLLISVIAQSILLYGPGQVAEYLPQWMQADPSGFILRPTASQELLKEFLAVLSVMFVLLTVAEWIQVQVAAHNWKKTTLDGTLVWVSGSLGPAVFGFFTPRIAIPRWLLDVDPDTRAAALAHERQHIAKHDRCWCCLPSCYSPSCRGIPYYTGGSSACAWPSRSTAMHVWYSGAAPSIDCLIPRRYSACGEAAFPELELLPCRSRPPSCSSGFVSSCAG